MKVIKSAKSDTKTMFRAKLYIFFNRSLWIYLAACVVIGYYQPLSGYSIISSIALYFVFLVIIIIPLYYISAVLLAKNDPLNGNYIFDEHKILIEHLPSGQLEQKSWDWIRKIDLRNNGVYLVARDKRRMVIFFDTVSPEEMEFFRTMKQNLNR